MRKKIIACTLIILSFLSCSHTEVISPNIPHISNSEYKKILNQKTRKESIYKGFYNKLSMSATLLDTPMIQAMLGQKARVFQWSEEEYRKQETELKDSLEEKTHVFLSFFTPEKKQNNLSSAKSSWKVYLDVGGTRYEGKATRDKTAMENLTLVYPYHNLWSVAYRIEFPVSTRNIEGQKAKLTIAGAPAQAEVIF